MTTIDSMDLRLQQIHGRIAAACLQAGRPVSSVALLAVSKTFDAPAVYRAALAGQRAFGENYIQEALEKITAVQALAAHATAALPAPAVQWHCIGPIQSNKTRAVAQHFDWVHTVDRLKIAQRLSEQRPAHLPPLQVCIQVNIDAAASKSGIAPEHALALAQAVAQLPRLCVRGLMGIPDALPDFAAQYAVHRQVRAVFDAIAQAARSAALPGFEHWDTLSLGMTGDLEAAIAAGSTMVRVGSGIFGQRTPG